MILENVALFSTLSDDQRDAIACHTVRKKYRKDTIIIECGDTANTLYVIVKGQVKIYIADDDGREIVLNQQGAGSYFGELALLGNGPRSASVRTLEDSEFLMLTKKSFLEFVSQHPEITLTLMRDLAVKLRDMADEVSSLALLDVYGRIVKLLNAQAREEDDLLITPRLTHQDIADRVGASREMISKILKDLRTGGYLSMQGKRVIIEKPLPPHW